jgi:hypothetical protein
MRIGKLFRRQTFLTKFECIYKISCSHCFPCARAIQKKARRLKWRKNDLFLYFIMVRFFHSLFYEGGKFKCFTFLTLMGNFFANFYHLLFTLSLTQWFNLVFVQNSLCRKKACKKNVSLMMMCSTKTYYSTHSIYIRTVACFVKLVETGLHMGSLVKQHALYTQFLPRHAGRIKCNKTKE